MNQPPTEPHHKPNCPAALFGGDDYFHMAVLIEPGLATCADCSSEWSTDQDAKQLRAWINDQRIS